MKRIERWDKVISYGLVAFATWAVVSLDSFLADREEKTEKPKTESAEKVYPYGKIEGFFVYIVKGLPDDPREPELRLTLTPIGEPGCNIVWVLKREAPRAWSFNGLYGCENKVKPFAYYEQKFIEALQMYRSGFET